MIAIGIEQGISQESSERYKNLRRWSRDRAETTAGLLRNICIETLHATREVFIMANHQGIGVTVMIQIAWWCWHGARWLLLSRMGEKPVHETRG
jgi:hypothetical protein